MSISKASLIKDTILRKFENVTPQDAQLQDGVLAVMRGIAMCSEVVNENNRWYPRSLLYSKILNNDELNHLINNNALIGEGCHPEDRFHTVYPNAAILIKKLWIPEDDPNNLWIEFLILDTPVGRIINTLLKVGSAIGISARAAGTAVVRDGVEYMNEDDYTLFSFDCVPDPGFKDARPLPVYEHKLLDKKIEDYDPLELSQTRSLLESLNPEYFKEQIEQVNSILESKTVNPIPSAEVETNVISTSGDIVAGVEADPKSVGSPDELFEQLCSVRKQLHSLEKMLESEKARNADQVWKEIPASVVSSVQQALSEAKRFEAMASKFEARVATLSECNKQLSETLTKAQRNAVSQRANVSAFERTIKDQIASIQALESKCASIKTKASGNIAAVNERNRALSVELSELRKKLNESRKRNYALVDEVRLLKSVNEMLLARVSRPKVSSKPVDSDPHKLSKPHPLKESRSTRPAAQAPTKTYESQISHIAAMSGVSLPKVMELVPKVEGPPARYVPIVRKMAQYESSQPIAVVKNEAKQADGLLRLIVSQRSSQ